MLGKILPENLIVPPSTRQYNWSKAPYRGYLDIVPLDQVKQDVTYNSEVSALIRGKEFKTLVDRKLQDDEDFESKSDILHVPVYTLFLHGSDDSPPMRLVMADDQNVEGVALDYRVWDKGHKRDPMHILWFNQATSNEFIPPAQGWIVEPILQTIDYVFDKLNKHLRKSSTKFFFKEGQGGIQKAALAKFIKNFDTELVGIKDLPQGIPLRDVMEQFVTAELSRDHSEMFSIARDIFEEISRKPAFAKPRLINQKRTATEAEAIQGAEAAVNSDHVDKLRDYLSGIGWDWASLIQNNFQSEKTVLVENKITGRNEPREVNEDSIAGTFQAEARVESFLKPNKELKRKTVKETLGDLILLKEILDEQGLQLNGKLIASQYVENAEMRNPQQLIIPKPTRSIDQQVQELAFKGVPFNPLELGGDLDRALRRLLEIFDDDQLITIYEQFRPGISQPQDPLTGEGGEIIEMIQTLDQLKQGGQTNKQGAGNAPVTQSQSPPTDVGANAAQLGAAQTAWAKK